MKSRRRVGAITPLFAVLIPLIFVIAGFGIFIAWTQLLKTELRTSTDFAARAGAVRLSMEQDTDAAIAGAIEAASRNRVAGSPLPLSPRDIVFGTSIQSPGTDRFNFQPGRNRPNGILVNASFDGADPTTAFLADLAGIRAGQLEEASIATNLDRDICVVIDRSGSMSSPVNSNFNGTTQECGPLPAQSRFAALAIAIDAFTSELNGTPQREFVCLASYSSNVFVDCGEGRTIRFREAEIHSNLSDNPNALRGPVRGMLNNGISGATAIGSGLRVGLQAVRGPGSRSFASPTILLMTDGNHNLGVNPVVVAADAAAQDIVVHTITFSRGANQELMRQVAQRTGGRHIHADTAGDLTEAFREIARTLPVMLTQ